MVRRCIQLVEWCAGLVIVINYLNDKNAFLLRVLLIIFLLLFIIYRERHQIDLMS